MFKIILPKLTSLIYGSILPLVIGIYIFVDTNITNAVNRDDVSYFSFADSWLGLIILDQSWQFWIMRGLDFVTWGVIGGILVLVFWIISSGRVAIHNHLAQEEFVNFKIPKDSWHSHFLIVAFAKIIILFLILYCLIVTVFLALPFVIETATLLAITANFSSVSWFILSSGFIVFMQYLVILGIKLFNLIEIDD